MIIAAPVQHLSPIDCSRPIRSLPIGVTLVLLFLASPASAQVALTMTKVFSPSTVVVGGTSTTTMTVTITNPNASSVTGISFSDTYPAGLVPDVVGAYTCSAGSALFNGSGFAFSNVTLAAGSSCVVPMQMHGSTTGPIVNTTSQVTGTGVPAGSAATTTLTVIPSVPALSPWTLLGLAVLLAGIAAARIRTIRAAS